MLLSISSPSPSDEPFTQIPLFAIFFQVSSPLTQIILDESIFELLGKALSLEIQIHLSFSSDNSLKLLSIIILEKKL